MSVAVTPASKEEAYHQAMADLALLHKDDEAIDGNDVAFIIGNYCLYARCSCKGLPPELSELYERARNQPRRIFSREELGHQLADAVIA